MHLEYTIGLAALVPLLRRRQKVDTPAWVGRPLRIPLNPPTHLKPMLPDGCDNEVPWTRDFCQMIESRNLLVVDNPVPVGGSVIVGVTTRNDREEQNSSQDCKRISRIGVPVARHP